MISVIMGTYNGRSRIDKAISSIKKQTYTDWELIICDDCSSDGTYEYLINKSESLEVILGALTFTVGVLK